PEFKVLEPLLYIRISSERTYSLIINYLFLKSALIALILFGYESVVIIGAICLGRITDMAEIR
ncbi:hypothetical protein, partial [Bacteroides congonensis]|uniref:hypothetical protein n=1 Tax=Bacteroides congonensis TaxID=1871006 RepID=UPI0023F8B9B4